MNILHTLFEIRRKVSDNFIPEKTDQELYIPAEDEPVEEPEVIPTPEETLEEIAAGGDVELKVDLDITTKIALARPTNLDLGGKTITNQTAGGDAIQLGAGDFTIKNGKIDNSVGGGASAGIYANSSKGTNLTLSEMDIVAAYPIYLNNATIPPTCKIESGTYTSPFDKGVAVYVEKGGKVIIEGGYFTTGGHDSTYLLNLKDALSPVGTDLRQYIEVRGGEFVNFDPSHSKGEPGGDANFVADGYVVESRQEGENIIYTVKKA